MTAPMRQPEYTNMLAPEPAQNMLMAP